MTDSTTRLRIGHDGHTKESLETWRTYLCEQLTNQVTENGQHPSRARSTGFAMELRTVNQIIDLAQEAVRIEKRSGTQARKLAAEYLVQLSEQL